MSIGSALLGAVLATVSLTSASAVASTSAGPGPAGDRRVALATAPPAGRWAWPLAPEPEVVRPFVPPARAWTSGHRGVDLAATVGQTVLAPTDGRVSWTGVIAGRAVVVVLHDDGLRSTFEPVATARPLGTFVTRGDAIGQVASTPGHCAPRTCLHWGVLRGETYLDPLTFVGRARVILLPLP